MRAIGVPEVARYLRGEIDREAMVSAGQLATRQYAKRQRTWFRGQELGLIREEDGEVALHRLLDEARKNGC